MYKFQDLTPISGHFRTNFKMSGQRPGLNTTASGHPPVQLHSNKSRKPTDFWMMHNGWK